MSCVLRISALDINASLSKLSLQAFRVENDCAHFLVSEASFDDLKAQIKDTLAFLQLHRADMVLIMGKSGANGVLDFAIEWRDVAFQFDNFPAELVREAGNFGLSLALSHYPASQPNAT
jgi:hypothetical protein